MRSTRKKNRSNLVPIVMISILVLILLVSAGYFINEFALNDADTNDANSEQTTPDSETVDPEPEPEPEPDPEPEPEPEPDTFTDIRIAATGDIMFHSSQLESAYDSDSKTYDFKSVFEDVKPILSAADLTLGNYETTAAGPDKAYTGYPAFNSPDETFDAIKYAGFDVLTTVNNHSLDTGSQGLKRTVEVIREKGLASTGTYDKKPDSRILWQDVKGIKIAIIAYTESTNGLGSQYGEDELNAMLNLMNKDTIIADIKEAKAEEADLIISFMHWGTEYENDPNAKQVEFAELMAGEGVDIILGSHPHVIQKSEFLEVDDNEAYVIYSMGNFVSNQRIETLGDDSEKTENGVIVNIDVRKNDQTKETFIQNVEYVPTWVYRDKEKEDATYTYRILPVEDFINSDEISDAFKGRMKQGSESTVSKMVDEPKSKD